MGIFKEGSTEKIIMGVVMLVIVAVIFIFSSQGKEPLPTINPQTEPTVAIAEELEGIAALEKSLEEKIAINLEKMKGVGKVKVLVTYNATLRKEFAKDESVTKKTSKETDKEGGTRETVEETESNRPVLVGNTGALIIVEQRPQVSGVLIIAEGASDPKVKEQIFEAVRTLLDIPASKISVAPMGGILGV
ncbi:MAG: stage III sporulation protein AG [Gracilibacter sp. BRH_c7a]|nr:MAG: stage III sporulation protein AG [Gracilibacter sp. BRH_c7a]